MEHEGLKGKIEYTSLRKGMEGKWRGMENFLITKHHDGRRTLRATCVIDENEPRVLRDCLTNIDENWNLVSGFVQISVDGAYTGSALYDVNGDEASITGLNRTSGPFSKKVDLAGKTPGFFGSHALQADGFMTRCFDLARPGERQVIPMYIASSAHHRGADGPDLVVQHDISLTLLGEETITVKAGTFDALHFRVGDSVDDEYPGSDRHPPYHIWVSADGEYVYLKGHITGYMQSLYELVEFQRGPGLL